MAADAATTYQCVQCRKTKPGRFTRPVQPGTIATGWASKGKGLPAWYCYTCLPRGQGRDEVGQQPDLTPPKTLVMAKIDPAKTKTEGLQVVQGLQKAVYELEVQTEEQYQVADALLARVRSARKTWGDRMERIIRPMRTALDEVYSLNRDVDKPLGQQEDFIKSRMKAFKLEELRQLNAAKQAQQAEDDRLAREAWEKEQAALAAKTPQMRGKLEAQAEKLTEQRAEVLAQEMAAPVAASNSSSRSKKLVRVTDLLAFCGGIGDGTIPHDVVAVLAGPLAKHLKESPDDVASWPGVEIVDDIQIVGR